MRRPDRGNRAFTLIELVVVMGLIGLISAIALPRLLPVIAFSAHEGAARRLAGYGRTAMGQAALMHERYVFKVDLKNQEYWTERLPTAEEQEEADQESRLFSDQTEEKPKGRFELFSLAKTALKSEGDLPDEETLKEQTDAMTREFERISRLSLETRAKRVVHDHRGVLDGVGNLFESEFKLDSKSDDLKPEEVRDPLLARSAMPDNTVIESVVVGDVDHRQGVVEISITPTGLEETVIFYVRDDEGDYYTVTWDAITGGARLARGRQGPTL